MRYTPVHHILSAWLLTMMCFGSCMAAFAQSELHKRTLIINGQSGEAVIYRIDGQSFVDLETLARIGNGSLSFQGDQISLTLPAASAGAVPVSSPLTDGMSKPLMTAALHDLALIKEWQTTLAYAIQRGVPGDGSRLVVFHDRAAAGLRLATVEASNRSDHDAVQLLTNHFNQVDRWNHKLVEARKSMSTGNYSFTPNSLDKDPEYQKIANCSQFLSTMLAGGQLEDNPACH
jgi:hypothetical protein